MKEILGVILAGGASTRMGRDKAQVMWKDKSFLAHVYESMEDQVDEVWISGSKKHIQEVSRVLTDRYPHQGPMGGIFTVFETLQKEMLPFQWVLLMPVDMPMVEPKHHQTLIEEKSKDVDMIFFYMQHFPLLIQNTNKIQTHMESFFQKTKGSAHCSIKNFLESLKGKTLNVSEDEKWKFQNINDPQALERIKHL